MEADIGAAVAMLAMRLFTGESPFYTEPFSADYASNAVLMGHAGLSRHGERRPRRPVRIINDVEYENSDAFTGAVSFFKYRHGPVTAINSVWDGEGLRWCCIEGQSLPVPARMEGNSHLVFRRAVPVRDFFRRVVEVGVSQALVFVPGHRGTDIFDPVRYAGGALCERRAGLRSASGSCRQSRTSGRRETRATAAQQARPRRMGRAPFRRA